MSLADGYRIGVDLGGTRIKAAVFDAHFGVIVERSDPTEAARGPGEVIRKIKNIVHEMLLQNGIEQQEILCMGVGIPGLLDPKTGISIFSPNFPGWEQIPVVELLKAEFRFPVYIDNDVRVNLYGEWLFGAGRGCTNVMLITLGTGLGSGIIQDGRMVYGTTASAGEIGHMNMYREGRPCRCGSSGCLGRYASAVGMVRTFTEQLNEGNRSMIQDWTGADQTQITAEMISQAYDQGDALAIKVMHETGEILGYGLANVVNLLNPQMIIVGGGMSAAGDRLLDTVRKTVDSHALKLSSSSCQILQAELGVRAGMLGAAAYAKLRSQGLNDRE
ncbi:ROK family protein [Paenibacillus sp. HWE-109]|uniref:ROK family protein n=1 Tax=Paenibacillus sp. HWE-109 TaxID=1306526 RepID=UPI001EDCBC2B|nr:ROK family protein [Paenibacillus sp. HWE-109]UKS25469.1 ROK family protein [Paenibacillus sp. HWE-109]